MEFFRQEYWDRFCHFLLQGIFLNRGLNPLLLLLSRFSSQPGLTPPPGVGCREKLLEQGKGVLLPIVVLSGAALQKERPAAAAAAKSLQSCPTLCDPIDGLLPGSSVPGILQARTLEWVAISFSNA